MVALLNEIKYNLYKCPSFVLPSYLLQQLMPKSFSVSLSSHITLPITTKLITPSAYKGTALRKCVKFEHER